MTFFTGSQYSFIISGMLLHSRYRHCMCVEIFIMIKRMRTVLNIGMRYISL